MSKNCDQKHCENHDCVGQLEIGQAGCLLNDPCIVCDLLLLNLSNSFRKKRWNALQASHFISFQESFNKFIKKLALM